MSDKNASAVLVWDGSQAELPDLWQKFVYKEGSTEYVVATIDGKKFVVDSENGSPVLAISVRMFPGKTGEALYDVLFKSGLATAEELAQIAESDDNDALFDLFEKLADELKSQNGNPDWIQSKGITLRELFDVRNIIKLKALMVNLSEFLQ